MYTARIILGNPKENVGLRNILATWDIPLQHGIFHVTWGIPSSMGYPIFGEFQCKFGKSHQKHWKIPMSNWKIPKPNWKIPLTTLGNPDVKLENPTNNIGKSHW